MDTAVPAAQNWETPLINNIDEKAWYLMQTNGMEWRDHDLFLTRGIQVLYLLRDEIKRGRPVRIAKVLL